MREPGEGEIKVTSFNPSAGWNEIVSLTFSNGIT